MQRCHCITKLFRRRPWLNWVAVWSPPMVFYLALRLFSIPTIFSALATTSPRLGKDITAGLLLGALEDLVMTALLVVALVAVDLTALWLSQHVQRSVRERFRTALPLKCAGWVGHFAADALLLAAAFLPSAARFSDPFFQSRGVEALVAVTEAMCILMALGLACFVDLAHWWPTVHATQPRKSMAPSFTTPTYLDLGFAGYSTPPAEIPTVELPNDSGDVDMNSSGVTILSAPSMTSDDGSFRVSVAAIESIADVESVAPEDHPSRRLRPRSRLVLFGSLSLGLFGLVVYETQLTAQDASPVVAAVALNPTLNELFDSLFHSTFLPADFSWDHRTATVSNDQVARNDGDLEHNARR